MDNHFEHNIENTQRLLRYVRKGLMHSIDVNILYRWQKSLMVYDNILQANLQAARLEQQDSIHDLEFARYEKSVDGARAALIIIIAEISRRCNDSRQYKFLHKADFSNYRKAG